MIRFITGWFTSIKLPHTIKGSNGIPYKLIINFEKDYVVIGYISIETLNTPVQDIIIQVVEDDYVVALKAMSRQYKKFLKKGDERGHPIIPTNLK